MTAIRLPLPRTGTANTLSPVFDPGPVTGMIDVADRHACGGPGINRDKDTDILALRHQLATPQWELGSIGAGFAPKGGALLAVLLKPLPCNSLRRLHLITVASRTLGDPQARGHQPDTRAHRHHLGSTPAQPGRRAAGARLHRDRHTDQVAPVHPGRHRARHQAGPRTGHHGRLWMNSVTERRMQTCSHELLDRTLIWSQHHLLHALLECETHDNQPPRPPSDAAGRTTTTSARTDRRSSTHSASPTSTSADTADSGGIIHA